MYKEVFDIYNSKDKTYINEQINAKEVLVIGPNGEQTGIKPINDALTLASYTGLDLVLINPNGNPPVAKIMDYKKYKYEREKKKKEAQKKQRATNLEMKEFRLSPVIDIGDFNTRLRQVRKYLEKGHKVKITIRFRLPQLRHPEIGRKVILDFIKEVEDISVVEQQPKLEGRVMTAVLAPSKK